MAKDNIDLNDVHDNIDDDDFDLNDDHLNDDDLPTWVDEDEDDIDLDDHDSNDIEEEEEEEEDVTSSNDSSDKKGGSKALFVALGTLVLGGAGYHFGAPLVGFGHLPFTSQLIDGGRSVIATPKPQTTVTPTPQRHIPSPQETTPPQASQAVGLGGDPVAPAATDAMPFDNMQLPESKSLQNSDFKAEIESLKDRLISLESHRSDSSSSEGEVSEYAQRVTQIVNQMKMVQDQIQRSGLAYQQIQSDVSNINDKVESYERMIQALNARIDILEGRVATNSTYVHKQLSFEELQKKADSMGVSLEDIPEGKEWTLDIKADMTQHDPIFVADISQDGRWRLKGYQVISWNEAGDEVQIITYRGDKFLFKTGERINSAIYGIHDVVSIDQDGQRMLIGDKYFIDTKYVKLPAPGDAATSKTLETNRMKRFGYYDSGHGEIKVANPALKAKADKKPVKPKKVEFKAVPNFSVVGVTGAGSIVKTDNPNNPYDLVTVGHNIQGVGEVTHIREDGSVEVGSKLIKVKFN